MRYVMFFFVMGLSLLTLACAQPKAGSVSTIPWDERAEMDGLSQQYGFFEDENIYSGQIENQMPL